MEETIWRAVLPVLLVTASLVGLAVGDWMDGRR